jgi:hypothetical protein
LVRAAKRQNRCELENPGRRLSQKLRQAPRLVFQLAPDGRFAVRFDGGLGSRAASQIQATGKRANRVRHSESGADWLGRKVNALR